MTMREDCRHFQSRTYSTGEVARFCVLDLAPEAPWRCPDNCPSYVLRLDDAGWVRGSLVDPPVEAEPEEAGADVGELLHEAADIVNTVAPKTLSEVEEQEDRDEKRQGRGRLQRSVRNGSSGTPGQPDEPDARQRLEGEQKRGPMKSWRWPWRRSR